MFFFKRKKQKSSESCGCSGSQIEKTDSVSEHSCCTFNLDDEIKRAQEASKIESGENNG